MSDKVKFCNNGWKVLPRTLLLLNLAACLVAPAVFADDDLGVTMRMVTDDDVTEKVTREIRLPRPTEATGNDRNNPGNSGEQPGGGNPLNEDGPPGLERNRPDFNPAEMRGDASERARERRSDAGRPESPGRPDAPGNPGRPDNPERPDSPDSDRRP